jgi:NADH-quinone oxidoreductase subunit N
MDALIAVFITGLVTMFLGMTKKHLLIFIVSVVGLLSATGLLVNQYYNPTVYFSYQGLLFDPPAILFGILAVVFTMLLLMGSYKTFQSEPEHIGEYSALIIFSLVGVLCMLSFTDLFMFFIGLEIMSIPIYVMAGTRKKDVLSAEASIKYFFTGAFATGVLLFGVAFLYGATGSFDLGTIQQVIATGAAKGSLLGVGILLIFASFLFKVGAAPFHFWSPDVYAGSPNPVTGYMAAVVKLAGLFAFLKLFGFVFIGSMNDVWSNALVVAIALTIVVGNLSALNQTTFKRLLAYSSISNAGYALLVLLNLQAFSTLNLWVYLFGYGTAIISLITISQIVNSENDEIIGFKGLAKRNPFLGFVFILSILSLAGVPPLLGFFGKYMVFASAFATYPWLVVLALAGSGIGVYYYLRLIMTSLDSTEENKSPYKICLAQSIVLVICALATLLGGLFPY